MIEASVVLLKAFHIVKIAIMRERFNGNLKSLAELEQKRKTLLAEQEKRTKAIVFALKYGEPILKKGSNPEQVCSYFFKVTAKPAIFIVSDIANYACEQIAPLLFKLVTIDNWATSARSLLTADEADVLFSKANLDHAFTADSVIMKDASSLESVAENASGKILALLTQNQRPIPFLASFP